MHFKMNLINNKDFNEEVKDLKKYFGERNTSPRELKFICSELIAITEGEII